ncbi:MAG: hypothetical protein GX444_19120 [Myxococcales bacterium]|nr:hypothetical protein [Myxococcales bacterium]
MTRKSRIEEEQSKFFFTSKQDGISRIEDRTKMISQKEEDPDSNNDSDNTIFLSNNEIGPYCKEADYFSKMRKQMISDDVELIIENKRINDNLSSMTISTEFSPDNRIRTETKVKYYDQTLDKRFRSILSIFKHFFHWVLKKFKAGK